MISFNKIQETILLWYHKNVYKEKEIKSLFQYLFLISNKNDTAQYLSINTKIKTFYFDKVVHPSREYSSTYEYKYISNTTIKNRIKNSRNPQFKKKDYLNTLKKYNNFSSSNNEKIFIMFDTKDFVFLKDKTIFLNFILFQLLFHNISNQECSDMFCDFEDFLIEDMIFSIYNNHFKTFNFDMNEFSKLTIINQSRKDKLSLLISLINNFV